MNIEQINQWRELITGVLTLIAGLVAGLWAYTKYVLERGLLPPTQFEIHCSCVGSQDRQSVLEILLRLKNVGGSTLVVKNLRVNIRYLLENDAIKLFVDSAKTLGRVNFVNSLQRSIIPSEKLKTSSLESSTASSTPLGKSITDKGGGLIVVPHHTFVQPQVEQVYTFVTAVPQTSTFVLIHSSFEYAQQSTLFQRMSFRLSRMLGLIQYSLDHVTVPHTAERVFNITKPI